MRSWVLVCAVAGCGFQPHAGGDAGGSGASDARPDVPPGFVPTSPRKLTFTNGATSQTLPQFQVLVALDSTTIDYSKVVNPSTDLAFGDATTKLPFEIEKWDPAGESDVWVRVPQIPPGTSSILMYFGPAVGLASSASAVWSSYDLVTHFTNPLTSSSGPAHAPTALNVAMAGTGRVATAGVFPGTGDEQVNFASAGGLFDGWNEMTLAFSIYPDYANTSAFVAAEPPFLGKGGSLDLGRLYVNGGTTPGMVTLQIDMHFAGGGNDAYLHTDLPLRAWTDIVYTYDGSTLQLFNNGVVDGTMAMSNPPRAMVVDAQPFYLGDPIAPFVGMIDELRIEQARRSADWALATHRSLARGFVTIGDP